MFAMRVEKHIIKKNHKHFTMLDEYCLMAKNLYNFANYHIRQSFCKEDGEYISFFEMCKLMKQEGKDHDYRNMPTAQSAQQILRLLDQNWKSFFASIKDWSRNKEKYVGRPKLPSYKKKDGRQVLILTNQECKIRNGIIHFPKKFNELKIKTEAETIQQIRFLPRNKHIVIEVIYKESIQEVKEDNGRYYSIDIGLDNLLTVTSNFKEIPFVINGKGLKSISKYYNKKISHYRELAKRMNKLDYTNRMNGWTMKRNNKVNDYMHKASRFVIDSALESNVSVIIIGNNKDWKRSSKMSKKVNQSFVGLPHQRLIEMIAYKAETVGIQVKIVEESYTSGTSFLDNEAPTKENYNKSRRKYRGLFVSNSGIKINADVNAAYQIMKKAFPNAFVDGIEGVGLHPVIVNV